MSLVANYRPAVEKFLRRIRDHYQAHGTDLVDILVETYPGNGAAIDAAGSLLREMEKAKLVVRHTSPAPTLSQRAFDSLCPGDEATRYYYFRGSDVLPPA